MYCGDSLFETQPRKQDDKGKTKTKLKTMKETVTDKEKELQRRRHWSDHLHSIYKCLVHN
jgi:hypothetical protein